MIMAHYFKEESLNFHVSNLEKFANYIKKEAKSNISTDSYYNGVVVIIMY